MHPELATFRAQAWRLSFTCEVHDKLGITDEGIHERFVIDRGTQQQRIQETFARWKRAS